MNKQSLIYMNKKARDIYGRVSGTIHGCRFRYQLFERWKR